MINIRRWISHSTMGFVGIGLTAYVVNVVLGILGHAHIGHPRAWRD